MLVWVKDFFQCKNFSDVEIFDFLFSANSILTHTHWELIIKSTFKTSNFQPKSLNRWKSWFRQFPYYSKRQTSNQNPENPQIGENPDSDNFHIIQNVKLPTKILKILKSVKILIQTISILFKTSNFQPKSWKSSNRWKSWFRQFPYYSKHQTSNQNPENPQIGENSDSDNFHIIHQTNIQWDIYCSWIFILRYKIISWYFD